MSGHSKWSKVKHQKEATDAAKGKIFTKLANAIIIAVRQGGGITDPEGNFKLRLVVEKARSLNMPKDKIEHAIERAKGIAQGNNLVESIYEAFGPAGVGIIIEAATDNKQRTVSELKNLLERSGGTLATTGAVSHLFQLSGLISVKKEGKTFDQIMEAALNAGASDIEDEGNEVAIYTPPALLHKVKSNLEVFGLVVTSGELFYRPTTTIPITDADASEKVLKLLTQLEELDDVQKVYANFDIPDNLLSQ